MLNFIDNYYEVTEQNIEQLRRQMIAEDIRNYSGRKLDLDFCLQVGHVLGNNRNSYPNRTGYWTSRRNMYQTERKKLTTDIIKPLLKME